MSLANWYGVKVQRNVTLLHRSKTTIRHPTKLQKSGDVEHPMKTTKLAAKMDRRKAFREASGTRCPMSPSSHYSYLGGVMIFWVAWLVYAALGKAHRSEMRWGTFIAEEGSAALAGRDSEGPSHLACPRHGTVVARFDGARLGPGRALTPQAVRRIGHRYCP